VSPAAGTLSHTRDGSRISASDSGGARRKITENRAAQLAWRVPHDQSMETLIQDLRYGARSFLRQPGFTITAVLALALGIGANTAVFSVVYAVLLKPLPYPQADALVFVHDTYPAVQSASVSFPKFETLRSGTRTLSALGAMTQAGLTLTGSGEPEQVVGMSVTMGFMESVGVRPQHGRWFTADEDVPNGPRAIILSHQLWARRFAADPGILDTAIQVNGIPRTVVGIMPEGRGYPSTAEAWVPLQMAPGFTGGNNFLRLLGRMRDGVTVEQVQAELGTISTDYNTKNGFQRDVKVWPLYEAQVSQNRRMLLVLQGVVAFVLLVACANVANLLLARSVTRQRELAIRSAIGAGRGRIFRQVLTESLMLSVTGGVAGVLLASWLMRLFLSFSPSLPRVQTIGIDTRVLLFTLVVAVITGLLFGLAPARQGFQVDPNDSLRDSGTRAATGGSKGASRTLVTIEVALALVLVIGAGLLVKSLIRMQSESMGYQTGNIFTFDLSLPGAKYPQGTQPAFYRRLLEDLRTVPGVEAAAAISFVPTVNSGFNGPFQVVGQPPFESGKAPITEYRYITPAYFETLRIPVLRGRDFSDADGAGRPVVIINQAMADRYFPNTDPIGAMMQLGADAANLQREVIGVVGAVRGVSLAQAPVPEVFIPFAQVPRGTMGMVVRFAETSPHQGVISAVRARVAALDPDLPLVRPQMLEAAVDRTTGNSRMISILTSVFALVAAVLASVGIYSLIAYSVEQRTREIGIRVALGANRRSVVKLIVVEGLALAGAGLAIGLAGSYFLTQTLQTMLYEVEPTDPAVLAGTCAGVFGVAVLASVVPALRALRVDPMIALRAD
jgi:putative ABC transport system permease protein